MSFKNDIPEFNFLNLADARKIIDDYLKQQKSLKEWSVGLITFEDESINDIEKKFSDTKFIKSDYQLLFSIRTGMLRAYDLVDYNVINDPITGDNAISHNVLFVGKAIDYKG